MFKIRQYKLEDEGKLDFYTDFLPLIDSNLSVDNILVDYTDGIINGNLLEFKKNINNLNEVLFQSIKYLSIRRIKGKPVPANILLISLNDGKAYLYHSNDYLKYIEIVYNSSASVNTKGFIADKPIQILNYITNGIDENKLIDILKEKCYTKIHIDENCIVGWGRTFYTYFPNSRKADFIGDEFGKVKIIGEIRNPNKLKEYIYPYEGKTNIKFKYLMDRLNDDLQKKNLGAFYTPSLYAEKSLELVREAIKRVPKGNDYIILDRCAGTGNLEAKLTKEELSHVIMSTYEYYEYKVLIELYSDKVRRIIPPIEKDDTFNMGFVKGADALSEEYLNEPYIKQFIDNPQCTIILFENPPYSETTSLEHQRKKQSKKSSLWKDNFLAKKMKEEIQGAALNDLGNVFIWSAFKYYLRQPTDSYIVYSPVKYWKAQHLINKQFIKGFAFNRKHFHTNSNACIMVALWANINSNIEEFVLEGFDIEKDNKLSSPKQLEVKKVHTLYSKKYYDKRLFLDNIYDGILTELNGLEVSSDKKIRIKPVFSKEMLGYLVADSVGFDQPDTKSSLLVAGRYNGNGFYLHKDNYLEKLPMFAASRYITYNRNWTERARIMKSADGCNKFTDDVANGKLSEFLLKCLFFTCMETQNHMRSFYGSDGRFYRNELCLDTTNGETVASKELSKLTYNKVECNILKEWNNIISYVKTTNEYDHSLTYGVFQIEKEINTFSKNEQGDIIYNYPELNGALKTLKCLIKEYYNSEIVPVLFQYEFLK